MWADDRESWPIVEETVLRLFDRLAKESSISEHVAIGPLLAEMHWAEIESAQPIAACELLFRAQGRSLAHTDCLDRLMLAELASVLGTPADRIVLPSFTDWYGIGSNSRLAAGILLGPPRGRLAVPLLGPLGQVSIGVVDAERLSSRRLDTFDKSVYWTWVFGTLDGDLTEASAEWGRAISAAQRAISTELVALADQSLLIAVKHIEAQETFGSPIDPFQSSRHLLADVSATLEGARALLAESWQFGGRHSALIAKAATGRANREVSDAAMRVCRATGVGAEHELYRYVVRGLQIDSLCGSYRQLETQLAEQLFDHRSVGQPLPAFT